MDGYRENCIEWITGEDTITLSISQKKFITKIESLCKKHPDKAKIIASFIHFGIFITPL